MCGSGHPGKMVVAAEKPLPPNKLLELSEDFSSETRREADLVDLMASTGEILKQALSTGVVVQNRDKTLYARLISRMLFNQSDMMPLYHRILQERRKRFLNG